MHSRYSRQITRWAPSKGKKEEEEEKGQCANRLAACCCDAAAARRSIRPSCRHDSGRIGHAGLGVLCPARIPRVLALLNLLLPSVVRQLPLKIGVEFRNQTDEYKQHCTDCVMASLISTGEVTTALAGCVHLHSHKPRYGVLYPVHPRISFLLPIPQHHEGGEAGLYSPRRAQ